MAMAIIVVSPLIPRCRPLAAWPAPVQWQCAASDLAPDVLRKHGLFVLCMYRYMYILYVYLYPLQCKYGYKKDTTYMDIAISIRLCRLIFDGFLEQGFGLGKPFQRKNVEQGHMGQGYPQMPTSMRFFGLCSFAVRSRLH